MNAKQLMVLMGVGMLVASRGNTQELVIDPTLSTMLAINGEVERKSMNEIKERQVMIQNLQTATAATVDFINRWQQKTYEGLTLISDNVKNAYQIYECAQVMKSIYESESAMIREAKKNPLALAFAMQMQKEMVTRAIAYYNQIRTLILKENDRNLLMDAGERTRLMREILMDLQIINGLAYSSYLKVRLVVQQGLIQSLNPFASMVNRDAALVKDVLRTWKF